MPREVFSISVKGFKELERYMKELTVQGAREIARENKRTLMGIRNDYRSKLLKHRDTNALYEGAVADSDDNWISGEVGNTELHGVFLEAGTRAHKIPETPKPATPWSEWLHFFWDKIGMQIAARQVQHPGTAAHPYLMQAAIKWFAEYPRRVKTRLDAIK